MSDTGRKGFAEQAQEKRKNHTYVGIVINMLTIFSHSPKPEVYRR